MLFRFLKSRSVRSRTRARLMVEELEPRNVPSTLAAPFTPAQIQQAYGFGQLALNGKGQTIAIVDAYNDPNIVRDMSYFNNTFGLQQFNVSGGPTLKVVNQNGGTSLPATNSSWDQEIALDVEWAHVIAPQANIILVEANNSNTNNLLAGVKYAAAHANVVSMSWGASDFSGESSLDSYFSASNVTFVASSGDDGTVNWPAVSANVLSVGGSSLTINADGTYGGESTWNNSYGSSGGGASQYEKAPAYQSGVTGSSFRTTPDVAYNADPGTGVYMYDSVPSYIQGYGWYQGWYEMGGTSAGAPQWAGLIALADQGRAANGSAPLGTAQTLTALYGLYNTPAYALDFHDITTNQSTGGNQAGVGYDRITGLGSPIANNLVPYLVSYSGTASSQTKTGTSSGTQSPTKSATHHDDGTPVAPPAQVVIVTAVPTLTAGATVSTPGTSFPTVGTTTGGNFAVLPVGTAALPSSNGVEARSTGTGATDLGGNFGDNGPAMPVAPPVFSPPELLPAPAMPEAPKNPEDSSDSPEDASAAGILGQLGSAAVIEAAEETRYRDWTADGVPSVEMALLAAAFTGWWGACSDDCPKTRFASENQTKKKMRG